MVGVMRVEFTGRFVTDFVTHAEVRLLEEGGTSGWDQQLLHPPRPTRTVAMKSSTNVSPIPAAVERLSMRTPTGPTHVGHIYNAEVNITGSVQDGPLCLWTMATPGGPSGWIDENLFTADIARCIPYFGCYTTTAPAFAEFATEGAMIGHQGPSLNGGCRQTGSRPGRRHEHLCAHRSPADPATGS